MILKRDANQTSAVILSLVDQEGNNIYKYESDVCFLGNKKFELDSDSHGQFATVISSQLRHTLIKNKTLTNQEAYYVLSKSCDHVMGMRIPDLKYIVMNNFEDLKKKDFFQCQEILDGKSLADICITDPYAVEQAIESWDDEKDLMSKSSVIDHILSGDVIRKKIFIKIGLYQKTHMIHQDMNFTGTV